MPGDLEDFLRRAAERRAQKQGGGGAQRQAPAPQTRPKPQYTEAKRERQIRPTVEDPVPVAEVIEPVNPLAEQERRLAESKRKAAEAKAKLTELHSQSSSSRTQSSAGFSISEGTPAEQLLEMLRRPGGIQQAFLLREILDRPADRW